MNIDFKNRLVTMQAEDGRVARYAFGDPQATALPTEPAQLPTTNPDRGQSSGGSSETKEREKTTTLTGKLMTQPQDGKLDSRGKPTAWARFAAHIDGEDKAHPFIATFHAQTRATALRLQQGNSVTLKGYMHPSGDESRLDTLSVMGIVAYPGKEAKPAGERARSRR